MEPPPSSKNFSSFLVMEIITTLQLETKKKDENVNVIYRRLNKHNYQQNKKQMKPEEK